jgi:hypothetical protein
MIKKAQVVPGARARVKKTKSSPGFSFWPLVDNHTEIGDQWSNLGVMLKPGTTFTILSEPFKASGVSGLFVNIQIDGLEELSQTFYVDVYRRAELI